jgi:hypothetical protein
MIRLSVKDSNFSETDLDQNVNRKSAGDATNNVKNVVTTTGGLFSGSRNLCCISGFSPLTVPNKKPTIPTSMNKVMTARSLRSILCLLYRLDLSQTSSVPADGDEIFQVANNLRLIVFCLKLTCLISRFHSESTLHERANTAKSCEAAATAGSPPDVPTWNFQREHEIMQHTKILSLQTGHF